jgi:glycosyltransferase involved in cell wall biosynthesis
MNSVLSPQTFSKRVAFLISDQSLIQNGGIGQFAKAFVEMAHDLGWVVDLILDKHSTSPTFLAQFDDKLGKIFAPVTPLSYANHAKVFAFTDSINFDKERNFRESFMLALQEVMYDLIICNVPETFAPVYSTGITKYVPTIFYTHNESMIGLGADEVGPYSKEYIAVYRSMYFLPDIHLCTQSQANVNRFRKSGEMAAFLPMPMTERSLMEPSWDVKKSGVLYIGRWEERKNPAEYLRIIKETGLPAKVMTNKNGARKFTKAFEDMGITDVTIIAEASPEEKVAFIKSSKVFYNPALKEAFCYTMLEVLGHAHVVALLEYDWSVEFDDYPNVRRVLKKDAVATIKALYAHEPDSDATARVRKYQQDAIYLWQMFVDMNKVCGKDKTRSEVSKKNDLWYAEHISGLA